MPINNITQTISTLPPAGARGVDVQTVFVTKQEDFQDHLQGTTVAELNTLKTQINTTVTGMNIAVETINTKASEASASASSASTSASTATTQAGIVTTKASEASTSASNALSSENKAGKWADESEDVPVESGLYSAKHWASKASKIVSAGLIDDVTPSTSTIFSSTRSNNTYEPKNSNIQGHISNNTTNPHNVTKNQVGLSNVDNTSDVNKPISTATSTALNSKQDTLVSNTNIKTINGSSLLESGNIVVIDGTSNQTIAGVKTFSSSPIVPTPTTGTQAVNKDYVDDKASSLPIGAILNAYTIFNNCIVAFGGEFNRADYPKLWAYLQANPTLVKTQAQWTTENNTNKMCGFFSDGNGTTTFRVPNLDKAFLRPDSRSIASYQGDAIRNITGTFRVKSAGDTATTGAFETDSTGGGSNDASNTGPQDIRFNASNVVPTSTENRPKNIAVLPLIVAK